MGEVTITSTTDSEAQIREALGLPDDPDAGQAPSSDPVSVSANIEKDAPPAEDADADADVGDDEADAAAISEAGRTLANAKKIHPRSIIGRITKLQGTVETLKSENAALRQRIIQPPEPPPPPPAPVEQQRAQPAETAAPAPPPPAPEEPFNEPKPKQDDFEDFDKYLDARDAWVEKRTDHQIAVAKRQQAAEMQAQRERQEFEQREQQQNMVFAERLEAARAKHEDWDETAEAAGQIPASELVLFHIRQSEHGPDLAYFLAKNPDVTAHLNNLSPAPLLIELGRIEGRLLASNGAAAPPAQAAPPPPPPRPVSKAPPPVARLGSGSVAATKDPDEMSYEEHKAWRKAGGGR